MAADKTPEKKKGRGQQRGQGASFSQAGAIPGASEVGWNTANPDADATKPGTVPEPVATTMETDADVEAMPPIDQEAQGPDLSIAGAMPGGSETSWATAYPDPDATKPESMPSSMGPHAESDPATEEE